MKSIFTTLVFIISIFSAQAQFFEKLADKAANSAERTLDRKVEQKSAKETDKAFDSVFEGDGNKKSKSSKKSKVSASEETPESMYSFSHKYVMQIENEKSNTTFTYYLAKNENYFGNTMESASSMTTVMDLNKKTMFMFTEAGDKKMLMSTSLDLNDFVEEDSNTDSNIKIEETNNTKVILNYTCREYKVTGDDYYGSFWITKEADITFPKGFYNMEKKNNNASQEWMKKVDGLMMEMTMTMTSKKKPETIKMTCVELEKTNFSVNTKDYKKFM